MKHLLLLLCCLLPQLANAQVDTAIHRKVYAEVNGALAKMTVSKSKLRLKERSFSHELRIWSDVSGVRKIEAIGRDDSGDVVTEYYFDKEALVFAFEVVKGYKEGSTKQSTVNEVRYYFKDGKLIKLLGGLEKAEEKMTKDIAEEGRAQSDNALQFLTFAKGMNK